MICYPDSIEDKLEAHYIREKVISFCSTAQARIKVAALYPGNDFREIELQLQQTDECIRIFRQPEKPGVLFEDIGDLLKRLRTEGSYIDPEKYLVLSIALQSIYDWTQFLKRRKADYPNLAQLTLGFISDKEVIEEIRIKIDEKGEVRANASAELSAIRSEILKSEKRVRRSLQSILEKVKKDRLTDEDTEITIREGRLVIPVKSEFKRQVAGFVHDESSSGQTVFMEPSEVLDLNNNVRELRYKERREIHRILETLAAKVRTRLSDIEKGNSFLVSLDFITAKAQFALKYDACVPGLVKHAHLDLISGYHPLLKEKNDAQKRETIPLNIKLDTSSRIIVISGPNAGGKSVALKTVGLLQYMIQCGIPIPVDERSVVGVFSGIFLDIGDSQSLENDLSTYSSRLKAMKYFMEFADKKSLVLIDEFGTGTEPQFGGALAEEILIQIADQKSFGVVTTHYGNIKQLAAEKEGLVNAAMRYDTNKLQPLFTLEVGKPGSSFAFEIARNIGLPKALITAARGKIGASQVDYDEMLRKLEGERVRYERLTKKLSTRERELISLKADYEAIKVMVEEEKKKVIKAAKLEASQILNGANKKIEAAVREIIESKADKTRTAKVREEILSMKSKYGADTVISKKPIVQFKIGDQVRIVGQDGVGEILQIKKKEAHIRFGEVMSFVPFDRLEAINQKKITLAKQKRVGGMDFESKLASFNSVLDVRGKRAEEVIPLLDMFINDALVVGQNDLSIIHGKGHGVLREIVRNHLAGESTISRIADEHVERGGSGITLVTLK